jgi:hypothetical protein
MSHVVRIAILVGLAFSSALAMETPLFMYTSSAFTSSLSYNPVMNPFSGWSGSETTRQNLVPGSGVIHGLQFMTINAPGAGQTYTITLRVNSNDTPITCTIADSNMSCTDTVHIATVTAGDLISYSAVASASAGSSGSNFASILLNPGSKGISYLVGTQNAAGVPNSSTSYLPVQAISQAAIADYNAAAGLVAAPGRISNFYINMSGTPGSGKSYTFTYMKNNVAQSLTCTISDSNTTCNDTNAAHSFTVVPGDDLALQVVPSGTPSSGRVTRFASVFQPNVDGTNLVISASSSTFTPGSTRYFTPTGSTTGNNTVWSLVEAGRQAIGIAGVIGNFYAKTSGAPGAGESFVFNFRQNGVTQTIGTTIANTSTSGSDLTDFLPLYNGDYFALQLIASAGVPSTVYGRFGFTYSIPPPTLRSMTGVGQ